MIGFVLADTLTRSGNSAATRDQNTPIADLYGKPVRRMDLYRINEQRQRANRFLALADPRAGANYFGGTSTRELVDAMILEHEADRLGIPNDARFANEWLNKVTNGAMNAASFEYILSKFNNEVGGEALLGDLASQIRIQQAQQSVVSPIITPLDVFQTYRDQSERASFKVVPVEVNAFIDKVGEPTDEQVQALYDRGKDRLPDPNSPEPAFKEPRRVKVELLSIDSIKLAESIKATLTEADLKALYESRKADFPVDDELPVDLFQGEPALTPARYVPFADVRDTLASSRSRELAEEQINDKFNKIKEDVIDAFSDKYHDYQDDINERKKLGESVEGAKLPTPTDLSDVAKQNGLEHETTPLLDKDGARANGRLSEAKVSLGQGGDRRTFADIAFDTKLPLFDSFELVDVLGRRYLGRRIEDVPAHVEPLEKIRSQVVAAWKAEAARPLAQKAAEEFAAAIKKDGGTIKGLTFENRPVIDIPSITKLRPGMPIPPQFPGDFQFQRGPATPNELPQIPRAGQELADTLFGLKPNEVAVAPDLPKKTYYVMTLNQREPASFATLFGPNGSLSSFYSETRTDVLTRNLTDGMTRLREEAGLKPDWTPPDETRDAEAAE
ncbi:hypothetical protein TA3x_003126 [Tundrisphaera sp. TA3]|uniref:hypothetical protein n=1 Tax=Tundrisphaera sp. TA3 TaxID=3435775 RepID=UPI003EBAF945